MFRSYHFSCWEGGGRPIGDVSARAGRRCKAFADCWSRCRSVWNVQHRFLAASETLEEAHDVPSMSRMPLTHSLTRRRRDTMIFPPQLGADSALPCDKGPTWSLA